MSDTTNHPTCLVCGSVDYLTPLDIEQGEWICEACDEKNRTTEEKHELDRNL